MIILRLFSRLSCVRAVSSDCLPLVGVWFRVSKQGVFSSMISFSMERERECHKSKLRFFEFVFWKDNVWIYLSLVGV